MTPLAANHPAVVAASWLLTYALHSTLLLGIAWVVGRALGERLLPLQELIWRAALVGALATTTASLLVGARPLDAALDRPAEEPIAAANATATTAVAQTPAPAPAAAARRATPRIVQLAAAGWPALIGGWCLGAVLGVLRLTRAAGRLRRLLRDRRRLPLPAILNRLARAMGIRRRVGLSASEAITVPFATGLVRPEICCPERMLSELEPAHRDGLLAHELAHVARRDPSWQLLYRLAEGLLFFQPLNRVARSRLEDISELLSDDLAVRCTGNRLGLAGSLLKVLAAGASAPAALPVVAAVPRPGGVTRRVERLLGGGAGTGRHPRWATPVVAGVVGLAALLLPPVTLRAAVALPAPGGALIATCPAAPAPAPPPAPAPAPAPPVAGAPAPAAPAPAAEPAPARPAPAAPAAPAAPLPPALEDLEARLQTMSERLQEQLQGLLERQHELTEKMRPTEEQLREIEERARELAERMRPSEEDLRRLGEQARAAARDSRPSEAELEEIRAHARDLVEAIRPSLEELRELERHARELAERMRPSQEEIARLTEQAQAMAKELRPSQEEIRRLTEEARRLADEERQRREEERQRHQEPPDPQP